MEIDFDCRGGSSPLGHRCSWGPGPCIHGQACAPPTAWFLSSPSLHQCSRRSLCDAVCCSCPSETTKISTRSLTTAEDCQLLTQTHMTVHNLTLFDQHLLSIYYIARWIEAAGRLHYAAHAQITKRIDWTRKGNALYWDLASLLELPKIPEYVHQRLSTSAAPGPPQKHEKWHGKRAKLSSVIYSLH